MCLANSSRDGGALQRALVRCYGQSLVVDGIFGWRTRDALKRVQYRVGTRQDGIYGPVTGHRMRWVKYQANSFEGNWYCTSGPVRSDLWH